MNFIKTLPKNERINVKQENPRRREIGKGRYNETRQNEGEMDIWYI